MASKRAMRRRRCDGKVRYETIAAAWAAIATLRRNGKRVDGDISAYGCKSCGGAHFGHTPFHVKQAMRDRRYERGRGWFD